MYWGIGITVLWFVVIFLFWFFGDLDSPSSLNELGDALAGIFAPLAFLWLVLGYVQQGKQLEQNTKALEQQEMALQLQIDEMRESVKQQTQLVELQQTEFTCLLKVSEPDLFFILDKAHYSLDEMQSRFFIFFSVKNEGDIAKNISLFDLHTNCISRFCLKLEKNSKETMEIWLESDVTKLLKINDTAEILTLLKYEDKYGRIYNQKCKIWIKKLWVMKDLL